MWLEMVWGSETKKYFFFVYPQLGGPWFGLAAQQSVSISWKALGCMVAILNMPICLFSKGTFRG
jgi:hypothetical protein